MEKNLIIKNTKDIDIIKKIILKFIALIFFIIKNKHKEGMTKKKGSK